MAQTDEADDDEHEWVKERHKKLTFARRRCGKVGVIQSGKALLIISGF